MLTCVSHSTPSATLFPAGLLLMMSLAWLAPVNGQDTTRQLAAAGQPEARATATNAAMALADADGVDAARDARPAAPAHSKTIELEEIWDFAQGAYRHICDNIDDYTCLLIKRELVNGEDQGTQFMQVKIRHEKRAGEEVQVPFSVYLRYVKPEKFLGREVLYVAGHNQGDLIARRGGRRNPNLTVQLIPDGPLAMEGNRYPITEIGFQTLAVRLLEVLEQELKYDDGVVQVFENAKVGERACTHYRLIHNQRRPGLTYHMAEVSMDDELGVPIYYAAYDFPAQEGGKPVLLEQYFYVDVKLNVGLTDRDFEADNPEYQFQLSDGVKRVEE